MFLVEARGLSRLLLFDPGKMPRKTLGLLILIRLLLEVLQGKPYDVGGMVWSPRVLQFWMQIRKSGSCLEVEHL